MSKTEQVLDLIKGMSVLELAELVKSIEQTFGVSAAAAVVAGPATAAGAGGNGMPQAAEEEKEQTEFDVVLKAVGDQKIAVIRAVKEIAGVGLKEAKDIVDAVPKAVKQKVSRQEADALRTKLAAVGAEVEIK